MTTITRIDPFRELANLFENFAEGTGKDQLTAGSFVPPVDVYEDEHDLVLKLEVPGVDEAKIRSEPVREFCRGNRQRPAHRRLLCPPGGRLRGRARLSAETRSPGRGRGENRYPG